MIYNRQSGLGLLLITKLNITVVSQDHTYHMQYVSQVFGALQFNHHNHRKALNY